MDGGRAAGRRHRQCARSRTFPAAVGYPDDVSSRAVAAGRHPQRPPAAARVVGGGARRAADRLRQHRGAAAGAIGGPCARDRDPDGDRRRPRRHRASAARREPRPLGGRCHRRNRPGYVLSRGISGQLAETIALPTTPDLRVLLIASAAALGTSLLFGLFPALHASRTDVRGMLIEGAGGVAGRSRRWPTRILVVSQVALGIVLVVGAGLLLRTFNYLTQLRSGVDPTNVVAGTMSLQDARYRTSDSINTLFTRSLERIGQHARRRARRRRAVAAVRTNPQQQLAVRRRILVFGLKPSRSRTSRPSTSKP